MTYFPKVHGRSLQAGFSRRRFVTGLLGGSAALGMMPALGTLAAPSGPHLQGAAAKGPEVISGHDFQLDIGYLPVNFTGRDRVATAVNGSVPAPVLRWREGDRVRLKVTNHLSHDSSIHWHGMILPTSMDGVPGLSFDGIKPGQSYEYQFEVQQNGTYWYHSHSGFQEQTGLYGAIVIDPLEPDPVTYDREHVILLSDWSDTAPEDIYANLKKQSDYYNYQERTAEDLWQDIQRKGVAQTWRDRAMWNQMRMSQADISDVTGSTYTYLINGVTPAAGWQGLFQRGEKVRLRFINGSAMTIFDVRIPGLTMTVVAADGQNVEPVTVDEFRIGTAETYDVIVEPSADSAYTIFAQNMDRSGYARGTLTPDPAWQAEIPALETPPLLSHRDMGMAMAGMDDRHGTSQKHDMQDRHDAPPMDGMDHSQHSMGNKSGMQTMGETHRHHAPGQMTTSELGKAGFGSTATIQHVRTEFGPQVDMRTAEPMDGLPDPGVGLRDHQQRYGRRVLTYADLRNLTPTRDRREPSREIEIHLTGNMHRYMWSMNGVKFADAEPLQLTHGERVRILLVNDTMMTHPIHLHGLWSELETGDPERIPRKHTILVQPGAKISYLVTADALGRWAYHCHLMFHMPGMFREVRVSHGGVS
ncbi:copper resistance system multicopper oxidase [Pseudomaricurvus hydrocarbonicus]|uniref:copper resistance system multicopper oxidase n=1 Tax=Pseudomaricurvus hydrocarbonicus TaxID=1470433 RepID=UPI00312C6E9B